MKEINFDVLKNLEGFVVPECEYRHMLDCIAVGDYIEASSMKQRGIVKKIVRNSLYVPVCVKILNQDNSSDYISVERIDTWKPNHECATDINEYCS